MGRRRTRLLAVLLTGAVVLGACSSEDPPDAGDDAEAPEVEVDDLEEVADPIDPDDVVLTVATHADALQAMADSIAAGSWRWSGSIDASFTEEDYERFAAIDEMLTVEEVREYLDRSGAFSVHGALGGDGSWRSTFVHLGRDIVDFRMSGGELFDASTLEPEVTALLRVDWLYLLTEFGAGLGLSGETPEAELAELRREAEAELAGTPFLELALASLDGRFAGFTGIIDLAGAGVTQQDLDAAAEEFREELIGLADRDTTLELIDRSVTLRDFSPVGTDGGSVALLDVHPEAAAGAIYDLFDDAAAMASDHDDELPETLEAIATVTFDGDGMMTEVSTDIVAIARQLAELELERSGPVAAGITAEELETIREMEGTVAVVFGFSDHGQVPTVLDVDDAVTVEWGELSGFIEDMFSSSAWEGEDWEDGQDGDEGQDGGVGEADTSWGQPGEDPVQAYWDCVDDGRRHDVCEELLE